jgi:hypothetical protein
MKAVQFAEYGGRDVLEVVSIADFDAPTHGARVSTGFGQDKSPALREGVDLVTKGALRLPVAQVSP